METEKNQKKDYVAPEMMEVELVHRANLLDCSDGDPTDPECYGDNPFG